MSICSFKVEILVVRRMLTIHRRLVICLRVVDCTASSFVQEEFEMLEDPIGVE